MFSRSSRALLVGAVLVAALAVATAQEQVPAPTGEAVDSNALGYGPEPEKDPTYWKKVGPTGPQGPQGPVGPQGPDGFAGARGDRGPQGPDGQAGPAGDAGADGARGPQGPAGTAGARGPAGTQGDQGARGPIGTRGPAGAQGPNGDNGAAGSPGSAGTQGPQGFPGVPGGSTIFNTANSPRVDQSLAPNSNQDYTVDCVQPDPALNPTGPARAIDAGWTVSNAPDPATAGDAVVCSSTSSGSTCQYRCYNGGAVAYGVSFFCTCGYDTSA